MPPDATPPIVVAIDGPAASGKSTTAKRVAATLGFRHVDSGSIYRAATAATLRREPDPTQWTEALVLEAAQSVTLEPGAGTFHPRLDGEAVDEELRGTPVTSRVSLIAGMPGVRRWANGMVRGAAAGHAVVCDGRDMGTVVFPEAAVKVFLVADPAERARRRVLERVGRAPTEAEVAAEVEALLRRDALDERQTRRAADAELIDTTHLTQDAQVARIVALARTASRG